MTTQADSPITHDQHDQFQDRGFLWVDNLITDAERQWLGEIYDRAFDPEFKHEKLKRHNLGGTVEGRQVLPQVLGPHAAFPELVESAFHQRLLTVARGVLGQEARFRSDHMILKPAGYGAATPWHQDQAYHPPDKTYRNVNVWIPLSGATEESGCLHFVPGSHRYDVLPHEVIETPGGHALAALGQEYWQANSVAVPCPVGSGTLHHSYLLHYAGPNQSDTDRRAYIAVFICEPQPRQRPLVMPWKE